MIAPSLERYLEYAKQLRRDHPDTELALFASDCEEMVGRLRRLMDATRNAQDRAEYYRKLYEEAASGKPSVAQLATSPIPREKSGKSAYLWPIIVFLAVLGVLAMYGAAVAGW